MWLEPPTSPGTGGVTHEAIRDVNRLTISPAAIGQVTTGAAGQRKPEKAGDQETWSLVWSLPPPACVTLGKILDFSLLQLSLVQIENHETYSTNLRDHYEMRIRTMKHQQLCKCKAEFKQVCGSLLPHPHHSCASEGLEGR